MTSSSPQERPEAPVKRQPLRRMLVAVGLAQRPEESQTPEGRRGDAVIQKRVKVAGTTGKWGILVVVAQTIVGPLVTEFREWRKDEAKRGEVTTQLMREQTKAVELLAIVVRDQSDIVKRQDQHLTDWTTSMSLALGLSRGTRDRRPRNEISLPTPPERPKPTP